MGEIDWSVAETGSTASLKVLSKAHLTKSQKLAEIFFYMGKDEMSISK